MKQIYISLAILLLITPFSGWAEENPRSITEVLQILGETHQVFFTFNSEQLREITVDFEFRENEDINRAIDRLLTQTAFAYHSYGDKYYVVYEKSRTGRKNAKKMAHHIKRIRNLEEQGVILRRSSQNPEDHIIQVLETVSKKMTFAPVDVTGTIIDDTGSPLPGVNIIEEGTRNGTITDVDGKYRITVEDNATLLISYIGFMSQNIEVGGRTTIDLQLVADVAKLEEIVVTGYGTQRKREITSAISSVSDEDLNRGNVWSTEQALQGKVPGLTIARAGGDPNQPFHMSIRGVSTLGANSTPLVVIDGVIGGSLDLVDPNDIASIDVLKDASAAAIYGTRGSAGVIIVTTKSGSGTDKGIVEYNGYVSAANALNDKRIRPANAQEFLGFGGVDYGGDTNFEDEILRTGISHYHNISFSNNSEGTSYRASINYRDVQGTLLEQGFEQFNARLNINQKLLDDKLSLTAILTFTRRETNFSNVSAIRHASTFAPSSPVYINSDPEQGFFENFVEQNYNPVAMIELNPHLGIKNNYQGNFKIDYEVIRGLDLGVNYSMQNINELEGLYSYSISRAGAEATNGRAERRAGDNLNQLFELTANYSGSSGDLDYTVLGGYSYQKLDFENFFVVNTDFITDELTFNNLGIGNGFADPEGVKETGSLKEEATLVSFFGRVNLNYRQAYYFMASYRREGSSRFGANNRWGDFWALGGAVDITALTDISFMDNLKVRLGYGVTGNLPVENYAWITTLGAVGQGYVDGKFVPAIQPTSNPNPDLKWEEKGEFNIGIDFAFLDFKLSGSLDYFKRNTRDLLNIIAVPSPPNLFSSSLVNLGELETNGWEFQLDYRAFGGPEFQWTTTLNFATNETTLVKFNNDEQVALLRGEGVAQNGSFAALIEEGKPLGQIISPTFAGYNDIGSPLFLDPDGVPTADNQLAELRTVQGNALPDFTLGWANTFGYKGFDLNFFFRGAFGHDIANGRRARYEHPAYVGIQNPVITKETTTEDTGLLVWHSKFVEDASYFLLDNLTLGYTVPFAAGSAIRKLRFYVSGQNIFTITSYLGSDPEVRYLDRGRSVGRVPGFVVDGQTGERGNLQYDGDILVPGMDRWELGAFPVQTWTLGVNLGF